MTDASSFAAGSAGNIVSNTSRRDRTVGIVVLLALGLALLYRCVRGGKKDDGAAPDPNELSLRSKDAAAVRAAAAKYPQEYQHRMKTMVAPKEEEGARPFIGFSIADNVKAGALVVDGVFEKGPAAEVGVDIDDELVAIDGAPATTVEAVRELVASRCRAGRVTRFTFTDPETGRTEEKDVWVMTADERFRGKPYHYDPTAHEVRQSDRLKQTWRPGQSPKKAG